MAYCTLPQFFQSKLARNQRGATLVEAALGLPLTLALLLVVISFGVMVTQRMLLNHAFANTGRYASIRFSPCEDPLLVQAQTTQYFSQQIRLLASNNEVIQASVGVDAAGKNYFSLDVSSDSACLFCGIQVLGMSSLANYHRNSKFYLEADGACSEI